MERIPLGKWCCGNCQQKKGDKCITKSGLSNGYVDSDNSACRALPEYYLDNGFVVSNRNEVKL